MHLELQGNGKVIQELEKLPGVRKASEDEPIGEWRVIKVRVESQNDIREAILDLALREKWRIRELHQQLPSLEDVFVELAASDAPPPNT